MPESYHDGNMDMPNGGMNMKSMDMDMHMSFYWGKDVIILFSGWPENNTGMYVLALLFVLLLGVAVEVMSMLPTLKPGTVPIIGALSQAGVYAFRMCFAYMVMLAVMSYNLGIFIAAIAGHTIGFFIVKFRALSKETHDQHSLSSPSKI